ncbi:hypothetical protein [Nakamurella sp. PAMC28650]|uniref:hypothetical protein n=1 Tax=Nakamurella sp. PAMC28650 TaxID=2762325 RepID=UPI00164E08B1|nr:hypothetical protein [Nakamurella sp. PAMC28650]QNK82707.1 hypothetical protein H7F38_08425 [Nakamurella sp. PAMC28650]
MKRISLMAALGAAVLLAGCSSTSGTATANTSASTASSAASSAPAVASSASQSSAPSSEAASSAASGAPVSSGPATSGSTAASAASPSSGQDTSSSKTATTTVGDSSGSLDAASAAWFSTFCGGFTPVVTLAQSAGSSIAAQATNPAKAQAAIVDLYQTFGRSFTDTAAKLKDLAPPTFNGGPAFASKVVTALQTAGPVFTANAAKLKAIDVTKDPSSFSTALSGLSTTMTTALGPLQDLGSLKLTPQTQAAFEALPACAKLKTASGG